MDCYRGEILSKYGNSAGRQKNDVILNEIRKRKKNGFQKNFRLTVPLTQMKEVSSKNNYLIN